MAKKPAKKRKTGARQAAAFPSKSDIIAFIEASTGKTGKNQIARHFNIRGDDRIRLKNLLQQLRDEGALAKKSRKYTKRGALPNVSVLKIAGTDDDGESYAFPAKWDEDEQGPPPKVLMTVRTRGKARADSKAPGSGDLILARVKPLSDPVYGYAGEVIRILGTGREDALGVVRKAGDGNLRIIPVDKKARSEFAVQKGDESGARPGELVSYDLVRGTGYGLRTARIKKRLGDISDQRNISLIALAQHDIPVRFPDAVLREAENLPAFSVKKAKNYRDMRDVPLITIDPPDARDHDDAIWAMPDDDPANKGGVRVIVAIADVAAYVRPGTKLDAEARRRGNSTYLPDRVVPMLPERLSTDLCSLKENEDRPALACFMTFNKAGKKISHTFERIIIRSAASLSYRQAQDAIDGKTDEVTAGLLANVLEPLWQAYGVLMKGRAARKPLELELPERKLLIDAHGLVEQVITTEHLDAHRLVEEFMIQANVSAAEALEKMHVPLIFRIHDAPSQEKLVALADFLKTIGFPAPKGQVMKPDNFNAILKKAKGSEFEHVIGQVVLRSQAQAVYSTANLGHFGLNLRHYAHFTSPIRRYADLTVHRALIKAYRLGEGGPDARGEADLSTIAEEISGTERRSMRAERDTIDRMIAKHLASEVRKVFSARISGISRAGLFVMLDDTGADGFIPAASLDTDYFVHDEKNHALVGARTGETFRMGDKVSVRLIEAAPVSGGLRFEMLSEGRKGKPLPAKRRGRRAPGGRSRR